MQRHYFAYKCPSSQSYDFSSSHVWMWELDYNESCVLKNWYFWTVVLEKTFESPLDCKEIQPVNPKGNQSCILIGRTWYWSWNSNTLATWCEGLTLEKTLMLGKIEGGRRRGHRGWDGCIASLTLWTWVWAHSGSWWRTGKPGVLPSMGIQRVRQGLATELTDSLQRNIWFI